jgi:hypothetical protein
MLSNDLYLTANATSFMRMPVNNYLFSKDDMHNNYHENTVHA